MSTHEETSSGSERKVIYAVVALVVVVAAVVALIIRISENEAAEAEQKADQLIAALEDAGAERIPSQELLVGVFGDDGGALCEDPGSALAQATRNGLLVNGAAGPGMRPIIADNRVVQGELLIIEVYCPEELEEFREAVADLELEDLVD